MSVSVPPAALLRENAAAVFCKDRNPQRFFRRYCAAVDSRLISHFNTFPALCGCTLLAAGGYGRGELYPYSDLDLLLLSDRPLDEAEREALARWRSDLWDDGFQPAVIAGTADELCAAALADLARDTAMLELRLLCGSAEAADKLLRRLTVQRDAAAFIEGKFLEMQQRHAKGQGADSLLEPNVKNCPGGLRDLHTMLWLSKLNDDGSGLSPVRRGILTATEWGVLAHSHRRLAQIRIALHLSAGRAQERLVFDRQVQTAELLGYREADARTQSEKLMRSFYRAAKAVKQLNGILLPMLAGRIYSRLPRMTADIDGDYYQVGNLLAVRDKTLFQREPKHIFRILSLWQERRQIEGLAPKTLRAWWQAAQRHVGPDFYAQAENRRRFIGFFRHGHGLTHLLRFLNLYGILARYLPGWHDIVGLLQHDLFHIYPVDDHTLAVVRNTRRFALPAHSHELPTASALMTKLPRPHILYLAALFHDIAKGRGGDHSVLGEADARRFAADHFLDAEESDLLCWLVRQHLLMSSVAQKEDLHNPDTIAAFAAAVRTPERLHSLYLLTVADIRGTNPKIWNDWKAGLLETLLNATQGYLKGRYPDIGGNRQTAYALLERQGIAPQKINKLFGILGAAYFSRHDESLIRCHLPLLADAPDRPRAQTFHTPGSDNLHAFVFMPNGDKRFAGLCRLFGRHNLAILAATAYLTTHDYILDSFVLQLPPHCTGDDIARIRNALKADLDAFSVCPPPYAAAESAYEGRRQRHLSIPPSVYWHKEDKSQDYTLEIIAANRRYLLADIAEVLSDAGIAIRHAKIATMDERVEDSFLISSPHLADTAFRVSLQNTLTEKINGRTSRR